jgi:hypothetical protein
MLGAGFVANMYVQHTPCARGPRLDEQRHHRTSQQQHVTVNVLVINCYPPIKLSSPTSKKLARSRLAHPAISDDKSACSGFHASIS